VSAAGPRAFLAFLFLGRGPNCGARHPEQRRQRCESAPHGPDRLHMATGRLWDADGPVRRPPRPTTDYTPARHHRGGLYLVPDLEET
jgi:hypothetical protein